MIKHYHGNMSDSNSSDSEDDADSNSIATHQLAVEQNPSDYDAHLKLIQGCKEGGELEKLRAARTHFATMFPLTEKIWLEWLEDEKNLCESEQERRRFFRQI